ncbi:glycosyltransferase [Phenylobacterium sp.]|jgi:hypothetical protein|uniref:glycosyltransferase n=1 Tax=Phenylobacterium sp. TaxID=1871053 RepID=UPI002F94E520
MPRILYLLFSFGAGVQGGHKMILRHAETARDLGFDAYVYLGRGSTMPPWFENRAPVEAATRVLDDDILVAPDDGPETLSIAAQRGLRTIVLSQNPYYFGATGLTRMHEFPAERLPAFMAVAPRLAATLRRLYPQVSVDVVPAFCDERIFRPGEKQAAIAYSPKKRTIEAAATRGFFQQLHPQHAGLAWREIREMTERQTADVLAGSSLYLSLNRMESLGITTLEAMASGCVCAGFTGIGGDEYATPDNGFWVRDDDCEAAADALAEAADVVAAGGPRLKRMQEAGFETARAWSYVRFRQALEAALTKLTPELRLKDGPLDAGAAA